MLGALSEAIDGLVLSGDPGELVDVLALADRLRAKIVVATGECRANEFYRQLNFRSMPAFLRAHADLSARDAVALSTLAKKLRSMKVVADAWLDATLSEGQIKAVAANVPQRHAELFAEHEAAIVDAVAGLTAAETVVVMRKWRADADAVATTVPEPAPVPNELFFSELLDGRHELAGSFDVEASATIGKALDEATRPDATLPPAQRRAEALASICQFYLTYHGKMTAREVANRERPHVNFTTDLDRHHRGLPGEVTGTGVAVDAETIRRVLCDANVHRYVSDGTSALLDYGRSYRSAPVELFQALIVRDGGCRGAIFDERRGRAFPCDRLAEDCEAHHLRHWEHGGETTAGNCALLCSSCHTYVHQHRIETTLDPDATLRFRNRHGTTWTTRPRSQLPRLPIDLPVWRPLIPGKPDYDDNWHDEHAPDR